jgi:hypothetical protein
MRVRFSAVRPVLGGLHTRARWRLRRSTAIFDRTLSWEALCRIQQYLMDCYGRPTLLDRFLSGFFASTTKATCARSRPQPAIQANQVHRDPRAGNTKTRLRVAVKGNGITSTAPCSSRSHFPSLTLTLTSHHFSQVKNPSRLELSPQWVAAHY